MLSPNTVEHLLELRQNQSGYQPGSVAAATLKNKTLLMFIAPSSGGKSTIINAVAAKDARFAMTSNRTSRQPRDGDDPARYTYFAHTDAGLQPLFAAIGGRQLVQYAVSFYEPYYIYATDASDYPADYCLKDVFFDATEQFRTLPFKRVLAINLVTAPDLWLQRFNDRFPVGTSDRAGRLSHAVKSLEWSLAQPDSDTHVWIENTTVDQTVEAVIHAATGGPMPDSTDLRRMAQDTLRLLQGVAA